MQSRFEERLRKVVTSKSYNSIYLSRQKYEDLLEKVKCAKGKITKKEPIDYKLLKRYDIISASGQLKLISPVENDGSVRYFVCIDELFKIIHEAHIKIGHGGRNRMMKELGHRYKNITIEAVMIYLSTCEVCLRKQKSQKKGLVVKPLIFKEMNSRCQVDLIDMQSLADNGYKFILVYQDHLTKFVILKPLKSKKADEVADHLVDVFTLFGAPCILQSDNGREFANKVVNGLKLIWPTLKIVHGKPRHSQSQGSVERANQDIENILSGWLNDNKTTEWSKGLRFVQMMKNRAFHSGIKCSPYEAMFGTCAKIGLSDSNLPDNVINCIQSEEELEEITDSLVRSSELGEEYDKNDMLSKENVLNTVGCDRNNNEIIDGEELLVIPLNQDQEFKNIYEVREEHLDSSGSLIQNKLEIDDNICVDTILDTGDNHFEETESIDETSQKVSPCTTQQETESSSQADFNLPCIDIIDKRTLEIQSKRSHAYQNLQKQAKKMKLMSSNKFPSGHVGQTVRISIPDVDRARGDLRNILGVIMSVNDDNYELGTRFGCLNQSYSRNQFVPIDESFLHIDDVPNITLSLRECAKLSSLSGGQGYERCTCTQKCKTKKCSCRNKGVLCNSKCHDSNNCYNKC